MTTNFDNFEIMTVRFLLRSLQVSDVTQAYLDWMSDAAAVKFINSAQTTQTIEDLRDYVAAKSSATDCLFVGIFDKNDLRHIGNIKFEPIDFNRREAVMGVLLGDHEWRGKSVFSEVFAACSSWLAVNHLIKNIYLGVDASNKAAISAYEKIGFEVIRDTEAMAEKALHMRLIL